jgi:DNA ligase-1
VLLQRLAETSQQVGATRARLAKVGLLAERLLELAPEEVAAGVKMLAGELRQGRIGIGHAAVRAIVPEPAAQASLTLHEVDRALDEIAAIEGSGSKARREQALGALFARATVSEQQLLRGLLLGELRQGALEGVMLDAIARAYAVPAAAVRRAFMLRGDLAEVAEVARREGAAGLVRFRIELMRPLSPMLAQSAEDVGDALRRFERVALEHKLDGARVQVHRDGADVRVFTRSLHEVTARVPELVERVRALPLSSVVLDGEALALRGDGRPQPFQISMRRFGRKLDVERMRGELPLSTFFFDCLHLDGEDLIDRSAGERMGALAERLSERERVPRLVTADAVEARAFVQAALSAGHEGVRAKDPAGTYEAGRRGAGWLKVKPVRTLDLVVLAEEWGIGRRRGS